MKKSELRQIIREVLKEQRIGKAPTSTMDMTSMGGGADMSQICAAAEALEREWQRNNGPKPWPLWDRFKHAIRHILGLEDSCPNGGGDNSDFDMDAEFPPLYPEE